MTKKFCDDCGKEIPDATLDGKWVEVQIGKVFKVSVTVYEDEPGDTDLCDICYFDAIEAVLDKVRDTSERR